MGFEHNIIFLLNNILERTLRAFDLTEADSRCVGLGHRRGLAAFFHAFGVSQRRNLTILANRIGRCDVDVTEAASKIRICGGEVPISINYLFNEDVGRPVTRRLPSFNSFEISLRYNSIE